MIEHYGYVVCFDRVSRFKDNPAKDENMDINCSGSIMDRSGIESCVVEFHGHKILTVSGEIDAYSAPQFKQALMSILDGTEQHLIVDMCNVRCIDLSGFAILHSAIKKLSPVGGTINLIGCISTMDRLFAISKLSLMVSLDQDLDDFVEAECV